MEVAAVRVCGNAGMNDEILHRKLGQFGQTPQGRWICGHCTQYGFVLRYKPEKADITGIASEPWHIRHAGVSAAREMEENDWCLVEYIENNP